MLAMDLLEQVEAAPVSKKKQVIIDAQARLMQIQTQRSLLNPPRNSARKSDRAQEPVEHSFDKVTNLVHASDQSKIQIDDAEIYE